MAGDSLCSRMKYLFAIKLKRPEMFEGAYVSGIAQLQVIYLRKFSSLPLALRSH